MNKFVSTDLKKRSQILNLSLQLVSIALAFNMRTKKIVSLVWSNCDVVYGCVALGGRPHSMSAINRHVFSITIALTSAERKQ